MDEEDTRGYKEPCPQCSEVNWGISDEGKFFCKSCHTVIEKEKEVDVADCFTQNSKIQSLSRGIKRKKLNEKGWEWYICEGFQFILLKQAEALQALGVDSQFKDEVLCHFWRKYLQKSKQAYIKRPSEHKCWTLSESSASDSELDSEPDILSLGTVSCSESEGEYVSDGSAVPSSAGACSSVSEGAISVQSGSVDGGSYKKQRLIGEVKMSMPMTLAFCYLSLLWMRESITLSDLLWFVFRGHIPYVNAVKFFPEGTKLYGPDIKIFQVDSFPDYNDIMRETLKLGSFLDLPSFPQITENCYLHPNILCMKYLMEINLPDALHNWTFRVVKKTGLQDANLLTFDPLCKRNVLYDIQAAAIIVVVLKLLFLLDDKKEWIMSDLALKRNRNIQEHPCFDFQNWYKTMKTCLDEAQRKLDEEHARYKWKHDRALYYSQKTKCVVLKKKQMAGNLQRQFNKLAGTSPDTGKKGPSSFLFNWEEQNTDRICFHGHRLEGIVKQDKKLANQHYWFSSLKQCRVRICRHQTLYDESKYPGSYQFILSLFSFMLRVDASLIHREVGLIERRLFRRKVRGKRKLGRPKQTPKVSTS
ncbi:TATA box-binding protein-associated factor RNA polymerase I subunit B [Discoglossus pictus]